MIDAKFYIKPSDGSIHMTLRGHAGAAARGEDLICAGATILAYSLGQGVQFLDAQGSLKRKPRIRLEEGKATIIATPKDDCFAQTLQTFWTIQCGCFVLARNYPEYVSLEPLKYQPEG